VATETAHGLVERAGALIPLLKERAEEAERAQRVSDEVYDAIAEAGILKMCAPARYGGAEADFRTQTEVLATLARGCPSTSWVATIASAMAWLASAYPDEAQDEMLGDGDPRMSGAFSPTGTAKPIDGGWIVNGRWGYNTGGLNSRWTVVNLIREDGGPPIPMSVFVRSEELTCLHDWRATGMAATGSNTIVAEDVFVPAHRALPLPDLVEANYPARHNSDNPYFNYPLVTVMAVNAAGTPWGTALGALDAFLERLPGRAITYTDYAVQAEAPVTHLQVGEAALKIESCEAHVQLACAILDDSDGPISRRDRVKARAHVGYSTGLAREATATLFEGSGASAIQSSVPIQRYHRDIQALANHAIMSPAMNTEMWGRVLVGLEPNSPLV
jgi:alkylation response protein AidB-like acyl-CoA dehydrogenase